MILQQLLGDLPIAEFLSQYYYRQPYASPRGCRRLVNRAAAEWSTAATCEKLLPQPNTDPLVARDSQLWSGPSLNSAESGQAALAAGYTICIRHSERFDPALAQLAADFHEAFRAPIDIQLFCTPAGQGGFNWHYDAEDVFVLQTEGTKDWWLRKNTVNPWPHVDTIPLDMRYEREIMPAIRCTLAAGDWLYIPAGYWHRTAAPSLSTSLSVGVFSLTGIDVLDHLRRDLLEDLRWRERLPILGSANPQSAEEQDASFRAIANELLKDLEKRLGRLKWNQLQSKKSDA